MTFPLHADFWWRMSTEAVSVVEILIPTAWNCIFYLQKKKRRKTVSKVGYTGRETHLSFQARVCRNSLEFMKLFAILVKEKLTNIWPKYVSSPSFALEVLSVTLPLVLSHEEREKYMLSGISYSLHQKQLQ